MQINSLEEYKLHYQESIDDPEGFWSKIAEHFKWYRKWDSVMECDFSSVKIEWFKGAKLNITENCLDRYLANSGNNTAIIWEPNDPNEDSLHITYQQLFTKVCHFANVLKNNGISKDDVVCLYMPMIPELAIAMLACARIGAVHSVVFAGFSSKALADRMQDSECKLLITSNELHRGNKRINLKTICDKALESCPSVKKVIIYRRTAETVAIIEGRDKFWNDELSKVDIHCEAEVMDAEDPLFILYTSGSTGKPKGMVHTTAGYMIGTTYSFLNVFQYQHKDIYWCTADIGWITGHSYILYGPLCAGATTVMFEGVPSYPNYGRFWEIIDKFNITHFYTAPTVIRALAKHPLSFVNEHDLSSLKILGSVGEPINEEAWHWYHDNIGKGKCPIADTWWQTETGAIMIAPLAGITLMKPTFATLPLPGILPALIDDNGNEIITDNEEGILVIKRAWPSMARTIHGNHKRYQETYFMPYDNCYFTGDGAYRDSAGNYRITGRVDDVVIVSGHNLGTAPIENAINEHPSVVESAVVGFPHEIKGNALYGYVILKEIGEDRNRDNLRKEINQQITEQIGPIAKLDKIQFVSGLPKTRSGKIMRRILRKIASSDTSNLGDTSTLLNPEVVKTIMDNSL